MIVICIVSEIMFFLIGSWISAKLFLNINMSKANHDVYRIQKVFWFFNNNSWNIKIVYIDVVEWKCSDWPFTFEYRRVTHIWNSQVCNKANVKDCIVSFVNYITNYYMYLESIINQKQEPEWCSNHYPIYHSRYIVLFITISYFSNTICSINFVKHILCYI